MGACDHKNLIDGKIKRNVWLHKLLTENSARCVGFDIDRESVEYCHAIGWNNIFLADMISEFHKVYPKIIGVPKWDYLVAGEIVEHLDNPVSFLQSLRTQYRDYISRIIITVPNAFKILNAKFAIEGKECINTDHRYWFTPYTICKVAHRAGFSIRELFYVGERNVVINNQVLQLRNSAISDDLILTADF